MSENINTIHRSEVKVGDLIEVSRQVRVTDVRPTKLGHGFNQVDAIVVSTNSDTLALTPKETVKLVERPEVLEVADDARVVEWSVQKDDEDDDSIEVYYALKLDDGGWQSSDDDNYDDFGDLADDIKDGSFGEYVPDSFKTVVPAPKPKFATGGLVRGLGLRDTYPFSRPPGAPAPVSLSSESMHKLANSLTSRLNMVS